MDVSVKFVIPTSEDNSFPASEVLTITSRLKLIAVLGIPGSGRKERYESHNRSHDNDNDLQSDLTTPPFWTGQ